MASGLPARPNERLRLRMGEQSGVSGVSLAPTPRTARTGPGSSRTLATGQSNLKPSNNPTPSASSAGQFGPPPNPPSQSRPSLNRQPRSFNSISGASSRERSLSQAMPALSVSIRSNDAMQQSERNVLRPRKLSITRNAVTTRNDPSKANLSSSTPRSDAIMDTVPRSQSDDGSTINPSEIHVAQAVEVSQARSTPFVIYPELDRYRDYRRPSKSSDSQSADIPYRLATHDLPPPTPLSALFSGSSSQVSAISGSPSTKFSESPGPGPYSRDTTPTSMTSQSPSLAVQSRAASKDRQKSPAHTRPPVTRRRAGSIPSEVDNLGRDPQGLAAVRECLSSSSNSTVRDGEKEAILGKPSPRRLPPPRPSPPPRKSSQKFRRNKDHEKQLQVTSIEQWQEPATPHPPRPKTSSPASRASPSRSAPSRPSRDGAPDLQSSLFGPVPVIHSNLSSTSVAYERSGSEPVSPRPSSRSNAVLPHKSRNASTSRLPAERETSLAARSTKSKDKSLEKPGSSRPTRTPSPNVSSSFNSRFPFFGRRKNTPEATQEKMKHDQEASGRKGPAAGTGHEGYGRIGAIRRRSGSTSNVSRVPQENLGSDSFLADRINPVIISGGEVINSRKASSDSASSESALSLPSCGAGGEPETSSDTASGSWAECPHAFRSHGVGSRPATSRQPSDSSERDGVAMKSTLAFRRSMQRLGAIQDGPVRLPQPIKTSATVVSPMTSFDTSVISDESDHDQQRELKVGHDAAHPVPKKLTKRPRSPHKWHLFGRSHKQADDKRSKKVSAAVTIVEAKPVAYYTMIDTSDQEDDEVYDVQKVLRDADVYAQSPQTLDMPEMHEDSTLPPETRYVIRNTPPQQDGRAQFEDAARASPTTQIPASVPFAGPMAVPARPGRLAQVGRIPQVVSNRPDHGSPVSFSRPFRSSMQFSSKAQEGVDCDGRPSTSSKSGTHVPDLEADGSTRGSGTFVSSQESTTGIPSEVKRGEREFLAFSPRKNSDVTTATSSSSSGANPFAGSTAVIPEPHDPPAEDEVWDEYNDLLAEGQATARPSGEISQRIRLPLRIHQATQGRGKPMESPTVPQGPKSRQVSSPSTSTTRSSSHSADMTERIRTAFQPHKSPTMLLDAAGLSAPQTQRKRSQSLDLGTLNSADSRRNSVASCAARESQYSSSSSDDGSPLSQVNLRVGSMTVSKWLTFGHVLFSDVRHKLLPVDGSLKRQSILVIDGLGNDDWSFYAAETYPAATFFNLSPRAPVPAELQPTQANLPLGPPNHHQVQYLSHLEKFPFAPQSFTSVVYRFPVAASLSCYRNILTEARRVLKPGGYVELSILDVDLNGMGHQGRRAVRDLKERIHEEAPEINLASTADLILRLLGKSGFSDIKAARVGVPVASSGTHASTGRRRGMKPAEAADKKEKRDKPSLAEMMRDDSAGADEGITRMVSRVARWWYTRCYESATGHPGDSSIWKDKALLRECEQFGSSLKLMVCCARAPDRIPSY